MDILDKYKINAKKSTTRRRIVMPEGEDERIVQAAGRLIQEGIADVSLLGDRDQILARADALGLALDGADIIDHTESEQLGRYASLYASGPRATNEKIARRLLRKPLFFGAMMLKAGDADAFVGGVVHPTARVLEAGMMAVGLQTGISTPSSFFLMLIPHLEGRSNVPLIFADCAVNIEPDARELER